MRVRDGAARALAGLLAFAGVAHFVVPNQFDAIVPRVLPGSSRFWTVSSGVAELCLAVGVFRPASRRVSARLTAVFFVVVFPANIQMAVDATSKPAPELAVALLRLPLQIPLVWWAWRVADRAPGKTGVAS